MPHARYSALPALSTTPRAQALPPGRRDIGLWAKQAGGFGPGRPIAMQAHRPSDDPPPRGDFWILKMSLVAKRSDDVCSWGNPDGMCSIARSTGFDPRSRLYIRDQDTTHSTQAR